MIRVVNVSKAFGAFRLGPVSADIEEGVTGLLGANGAGKTTLIRILAGLLPPDSGEVAGEVGASTQPFGYLPQDFMPPKRVTARDYLRFIAWCRSSKRQPISTADVEAVGELVGLSSRLGDRIGSLSGGMVRRLGIAQALLGRPGALLLDEPTVGLDVVQRRDLRSLLVELGSSITVLLSTHLSEDVAATADRVLVLDDGAVAFTGTTTGLCELGGSTGVSGPAVEMGFLTTVKGSEAR